MKDNQLYSEYLEKKKAYEDAKKTIESYKNDFINAGEKLKRSLINEILDNLCYKNFAQKFSATYGLCSKFEDEYLGYGSGLIMKDEFYGITHGGFEYRCRSMEDGSGRPFTKCTIPQLEKPLGQIIAYNEKYNIPKQEEKYLCEIHEYIEQNKEAYVKVMEYASSVAEKLTNQVAELRKKFKDKNRQYEK